MASPNNEAWVTSALDDHDVIKALVLAQSLRKLGTDKRLALITGSNLSDQNKAAVKKIFDITFPLEQDYSKLNGFKSEDYAKIFAFSLQFFEKCVYLTPSSLVLKNCDEIFEKPSMDFCIGVDGNDNPDTSVFLYKPQLSTFENLLNKAKALAGKEPFGKFVKTWMINQNKEVEILEKKFHQKLSLQGGGLLAETESNLSIVNFEDVGPNEIKESIDEQSFKRRDLGILESFIVNQWWKVYLEDVQDIFLESKAPENIPSDHWEWPKKRASHVKEPIAIVGMSCRYPDADNVDEFWQLLNEGREGIREVPLHRWTRESVGRRLPEQMRKTRAGFLKAPVDEFDAKFFGISPKEAVFMDPQQRLLHEVSWEALEDAAVDPSTLYGSRTGVFTGSWMTDYRDIIRFGTDKDFFRSYMGNSIGSAAARLSFLLGLTGPSIATESGCSSSMVAVHLACKSLRCGESNLALACGVNMILHPFTPDMMNYVIAPDGRCKTFDAKADGFGRAEGCGVLILKKISDAIKDGDHIWGVIRGSSVAQEGVSRSLGTPTVHCEALAMTLAMKDAGVEPHQVTYVETHGTGTSVGDPMEIAAISKAYSKNKDKREMPLIIGSVKTNVGHTESCSGITGIMKAILSLQHEMIPPHRNFETLNPEINLDVIPAEIPLIHVPWPKKQNVPRLAGVSSFGITGTDGHVVIQEPPKDSHHKIKLEQERPLHILKLSTKTGEALDELLLKYEELFKEKEGEEDFADSVFTANIGRASFNHRAFIVAKNYEDAAKIIAGRNFPKSEVSEEPGKICFLFTGQGSQYPGMAKTLYETSPIFKMNFDKCDQILQKGYSISIREALWGSADKTAELSRTIYSQTSIFCIEYCLLKLWESWGIKPDFAMGHSLGEFGAAVACGILDLEGALKLVAERSRLIDNLPRGKMLVLKADHNTVTTMFKKFASGPNSKYWLDVAAVNSQEQTVMAGDSVTVEKFSEFCANNHVKNTVLEATHAFHSRHMNPMLEEYRMVATGVPFNKHPTGCQYISGLDGKLVEADAVNEQYWVRHTREKVQFLDASKAAVVEGCKLFVEVGPQPILSSFTLLNNEGAQMTCLPSIRRGTDDWITIFNTLGKLYLAGVPINWEGVDQYYGRRKITGLPFHPFIRKKFWIEVNATGGTAIHPLLGYVLPNASASKIYQSDLTLKSFEYMKDHAIGNRVVFPGAGYLEMCLTGGHASAEGFLDAFVNPTRPVAVENLKIEAPLALEESKSCQMQVVVDMDNDNKESLGYKIKIFHLLQAEGTTSSKWVLHASAGFTPLAANVEEYLGKAKIEEILARCVEEDASEKLYDKIAEVGLKFGPTFRTLEKVWRGENEYLAQIIEAPEDACKYVIHPTILDAMLQAAMIMLSKDRIKKKLHVPISIGKFIYLGTKPNTTVAPVAPIIDKHYIHCTSSGNGRTSAFLMKADSTPIAIMLDMDFVETTVRTIESMIDQQTWLMPTLWEEAWRPTLGPLQSRYNNLDLPQVFDDVEFSSEMSKHNDIVHEELLSIQNLEAMLYHYILTALYDLGWKPEVGQTISVDEFITSMGITPQHKQLVRYYFTILEEEGVIQMKEGGESTGEEEEWTVVKMPPDADGIILNDKCLLQVLGRQSPANMSLITELGTQLKDILTGKVSPLPILFSEDPNKASVEKFYQELRVQRNVETLSKLTTRRYFESIMERSTDSKAVLRILELGCGTGALSTVLMEMLEDLQIKFEVTFTDISQAFFTSAEKRFEKYKKNIRFKIFNIEEDPMKQGFTPGYYDCIFAGEVIHAAKNVREALQNIRLVMRSEAMLWFAETLVPDRNVTFIFGTLEGYWRFEDSDLRKYHVTLPASTWQQVLKESGFEWSKVFDCYGSRHGNVIGQASTSFLFEPTKQLATTSKSAEETPTPTLPTWLLFAEKDEPVAEKLGNFLSTVQRRVVVVQQATEFTNNINELKIKSQAFVRVDKKSDIDDLVEKINQQNSTVEGVVYGWGMSSTERDQAKISQPFIHLLQNVASQKHPPRVYGITTGIIPVGDFICPNPSSGTIWGITKTYRNEYTMNFCRCIDILPGCTSDADVYEVFHELWTTEIETRIIYRDRARNVARFVHAKIPNEDLSLPQLCDRFQLIHPETKQINDLEFGPLAPYQLEENEIEVHVKASALNFKDVLNVLKPTEEFKDSNAVGFDFAGVVSAIGSKVTTKKIGDPVFGCNFTQGALPSHIKVPEDAVVPVPDDFTFCEAATLPAVFSTAYYCLMSVAKMKKGDTLLMHTASGGVGLSAIQVAKFVGANVIATAGNKRKRAYLRSIGVEHVFHSRNTNYEKGIMEATNGKGVDIVLNSLTGPGFKEATLGVCAQNARFVEMSKLSIWSAEEVKERRPDVDYTIVDLTQLDEKTWKGLLAELKHHMSTGVMLPIPYVRFNSLNIRQALNYLQKAKHIGKVVCVMPEIKVQEGKVEFSTPLFNDRSTYLITGGLGGIGFEVAKWMVTQGAKHVVLAGRSEPRPEIAAAIQKLNEGGNHVVVVQADVGVHEDVVRIMDMIQNPENGLPPLRGVHHAAGILKDAILVNQTYENFQATYHPKVNGSWNLHELTKEHRLEHFVLYSSMAAMIGSPGQANHTAANNFEDALAVYRNSLGMPATTVNWGQWLEVGIATEIELPGVKALTTLQGVTALDAIMRSQRLQTSVIDFESIGLACKLFPELKNYLDEKVWKPSENSQAAWNVKSEDFWEEVDAEPDREGKMTVIKKYIKILLRQALRLDPGEPIDDNANVQDMGVDSLMMVEMKNAVQNLVGSRFTVTAAALKDANTTQLLASRLMDLIEGSDATQIVKLSPEELNEMVKEDSELPPHITANGDPKRVSEIENILLTGATGNLAAYFLEQLLKIDSVKKVICLVRPRGQATGLDRLRSSLEDKGLGEVVEWDKIECIEGDITEHHFGLPESKYNELASNIDAIVHSAVKADHIAPYRKNTKDKADVRSVNVFGTVNMLEFAGHVRAKHVLHASTLLSVTTTNEDDGTLGETWPTLEEYGSVTNLGYPVSKYVAELLVAEAVKRGIPCKAIRFPLILGDSRTGQFSMHNNHFMMRLFSYLKMKCMPSAPTPAVVLPVDLCAKTAIQLFFNEEAPTDVYNVAPPHPQLEQEFANLAEDMGYPMEIVEYDDYIKRVKEDGEKSLLYIFKELYNDVDFVNSLYTSSSVEAIQKWLIDSENFFVSKKLQKFQPDFFDNVEGSIDIIKRDLLYAEKIGLFEKFELTKIA